jgi:hypothetical protein
MGDWCSQGRTDTEQQRNNGKGNDADDLTTLCHRKMHFSPKGGVFSIDRCLLMGDPLPTKN